MFGPDLDIRVIQTLLGNKDYNFDPEDLQLGREFNADFEKESIQSQIAYLDKLVKYAEDIKAKLRAELK